MAFLKSGLKIRGIFPLLLLLPSTGFAQHYIQTNLVSSIPGVGANPIDVQLVNAWGLARSATSPWWVSDNGTGLATIYNSIGAKQGLVVTIPVPSGVTGPSAPTGQVFNGTPDFSQPGGLPARFIFVTQEGTIVSWNGGTTATIVVDHSKDHAIYMGCAIAELNGKNYLYVANFHSGDIEVYDSAFQRVRFAWKAFVRDDGDDGDDEDNDKGKKDKDEDKDKDKKNKKDDGDGPVFRPQSRNLAPFNVQAIGSNIYVAYAAQDRDKEDEVTGPGLGSVVVYDSAGRRLARLQEGEWFNAPWGIAMAPAEFGKFSHALLVGMFGSGQIAAFNPIDGTFLGMMKNPNETLLRIDGLWALGFGAGNANSGPYNLLYFTAGPREERDGLFGALAPIPGELF